MPAEIQTSQYALPYSTENVDCVGMAARRCCALLSCWTLVISFTGCAAVTNPVANGVPVRMVPDELLAPSKEGRVPIDLSLLRQEPPEQYLLEAGDTLGIYVEGIIGSAETPPPVSVPDSPEVTPSIGYPFPIRADGTISLPFLGSVNVAGLTVESAEKKVIDAYLKEKIVRPKDYRILVSLLRPRYERILVVREDSGGSSLSVSSSGGLVGLGSTTSISSGSSATGQVVELPAYENDVLNALARTGGMPGPESEQEVIILRGARQRAENARGTQQYGAAHDFHTRTSVQEIRIPLMLHPGEAPAFTLDDIILKTGDIVKIRRREAELYYTGGLIPSGEFQLPFDRDITVVEALLKSRAPLVSGGQSTSNLSGAIVGSGLGNPSPSLVSIIRKTQNHSQIVIRVDLNEALRDPRQNIFVQAEDVLVMQENADEAFTRYITSVYQTNFFFRYLNRSDASGTGSLAVP